MKLNELKAGMYGVVRNGSNISVIDNGYGVVDLDGKYLIIQLSLYYNEDLTNKYDRNEDITELWYGDKLVFERKDETPRKGYETPVNWKPEYGEWYSNVSERGLIGWGKWRNEGKDNDIFNLSRLFKTKAEAERYKEWLKAKRSIELEIARLNEGWIPDWDDINDDKYFVYLLDNNPEVSSPSITKALPNSMYLRSKSLAEHLIETHEKELRIYLEVE